MAADNRQGLSVAAAVVLGAVVRLFRLGSQPLWLDESFTWKAARIINGQGIGSLAAFDYIAPGYYLVSAWVARVAGYGTTSLRAVSALAGIAAIITVARLARVVTHDDRTALSAAVLTALSPFAVAYSQEARGYEVVVLLSSILLASAWRLVEEPDSCRTPRELVVLALSGGLLLWFHDATVMLLAAVGAHALLRHKLGRVTRQVMAAEAFSVLLFVPWLAYTWSRLSQADELPAPAIWSRMPYNVLTFLAGQSYGPSNREIREDGIASAVEHNLPALLLFALACVLFAVTLWQGRWLVRRSVGLWLATILLVVNALLVLGSTVTHSIYHARYLADTLPVVMVLGALVVARWRSSRWAAAAAAAMLLVMAWSDANLLFVSRYQKEDYRQVPAQLQRWLGAQDTLLLGNPNAVPPMEPYGFSCPAHTLEVLSPAGLDHLAAQGVDRNARRSTVTIATRQWESVPEAALDARLDALLGAPVRTWSANGVVLTERRGALDTRPAPGLRPGCRA